MGSPAAASGRRQPIVEAAIEMTARDGWAAVTMTRLAEQVGVSRQTVYNEVYSKRVLAEQVVLTESAKFLRVVDDAFTANPDDAVAAIRAACRGVLRLAADNTVQPESTVDLWVQSRDVVLINREDA